MKENDPVHHDEDEGWFFWEETWADRQGPYPTEEIARKELARYVHFIDTGDPGEPYRREQ